MEDEENRIYFFGSPYPNGTKIKTFEWSGRLQKGRGLIFDFHLEADEFQIYPNDEIDVDVMKSFDSKYEEASWADDCTCILSSTYWDNLGILIGTSERKLISMN